MWWALMSSVGIECFDSLHRNIRIFEGTSVFNSSFHDFSSLILLDDSAVPSSHASRCCLVITNILYADFTKNTASLKSPSPEVLLVPHAQRNSHDHRDIHGHKHFFYPLTIPNGTSGVDQFRHHDRWVL